MRTGLAIAALLVLQGCGSGADGNTQNSAAGSFAQGFDDGFRKSFREKFIEQCVASANQSGKAVDFKPVCTCSADEIMKGKTVRQLMDGPSEEEATAALKKCVAEHPVT